MLDTVDAGRDQHEETVRATKLCYDDSLVVSLGILFRLLDFLVILIRHGTRGVGRADERWEVAREGGLGRAVEGGCMELDGMLGSGIGAGEVQRL